MFHQCEHDTVSSDQMSKQVVVTMSRLFEINLIFALNEAVFHRSLFVG